MHGGTPAKPELRTRRSAIIFYGTAGLAGVGGIAGLHQAWYKQEQSGKFHVFNDLHEWRGMDKLGHLTSCWWASQWIYETAGTLGLPEKQRMGSALIMPLLFMSGVEVMDGFSGGYGFSVPDMVANLSGAALFYFQQLYWGRQHFLLKASFHTDPLHRIRPALLGHSWPETWLKNYNGQTLWLSFPLKPIFQDAGWLPAWMCVSLGYGAGGMLGARDNAWTSGGLDYSFIELKRHSRYFLSLDIDLLKLPIRAKAWRMFASTFRWLKLPFPAIGYSDIHRWQLYALYW